jgi:hypothetical protein
MPASVMLMVEPLIVWAARSATVACSSTWSTSTERVVSPAPDGRALGIGDEGLDHERAARSEQARDVRDAALLRLRRRQVEEGVEGDEDEGEATVDVDGHVGEVGGGDVHLLAAGLAAQEGDHGGGGVDAVHRQAPGDERDGEPTGAHAELEHRPAPASSARTATVPSTSAVPAYHSS